MKNSKTLFATLAVAAMFGINFPVQAQEHPMMAGMKNMNMQKTSYPEKTITSAAASDSVYYTCSMHPEIRVDKPGKCPKCGMELIQKKSSSSEQRMKMNMMEHPEHPSEHPEHPSKQPMSVSKQLTVQELSEAVKIYVEKETKKNNGHFPVKDDRQNKTLKLTLSKVHDDRLSPMGSDVYFMCADFKAADGTVYDIDIFMKGTSKENLIATETKVHKINIKPRYNWYEENGIWKTKEVETKK